MASELLSLLLRVTLLASAAIVLPLLARRPLRRYFGAALAYAGWLAVPAVAIAAVLPRYRAPQVFSLPVLHPVRALAETAAPAPSSTGSGVLLLAWAAGVLACMAWFVCAHLAFLRRMGQLTRRGAVYVSAADIGPASVGLLRSRIVVPYDFSQRYSASEQALIVAHEQVHIARRDALANLAAACCQCLFWFNPLVHFGVRAMRQDQELACDAAVMARHPQGRRAYAEALLKSHTAAGAIRAGIHCHWQSPHPTKERIMSLQQTVPGTIRRLAGRCIVALLALGAFGAAVGVRADQAVPAAAYAVAMTIATASGGAPVNVEAGAFETDPNDGKSTPRVVTRAGESFSVASSGWRVEMIVRPAKTEQEVWIAARLFNGGKLVATPSLLSRIGERSAIKVGDAGKTLELALVVTPHR